MISFKKYINESKENDQIKHMKKLGDNLSFSGRVGVAETKGNYKAKDHLMNNYKDKIKDDQQTMEALHKFGNDDHKERLKNEFGYKYISRNYD